MPGRLARNDPRVAFVDDRVGIFEVVDKMATRGLVVDDAIRFFPRAHESLPGPPGTRGHWHQLEPA
ncbi:MAG: hypothetical protein KC482_05580, partial [Dehalococcoidia bacterium]|nr:hypothetical protein [Dehalococcoidia bacterium]